MTALDLDAYCRRIGYAGPREPTLQVLRDLCRLHPQAIPFENLDPLLGRPFGLDLRSLQAKLVGSRRGGYCFEHNRLLQHVLAALGIPTRALGARVLLNAPEGAVTPRTHMLLRAEIEGASWIVDVGFGRLTPTGPLLFEPGREQETPHESYRITEAGPEYELDVQTSEGWTTLYRFHLIEHVAIDHEVANHYVATAPQSFFRNAIVAARPVPDGRYALLDNQLSFHRRDGTRETCPLPNVDMLIQALDQVFGIEVPDHKALAAAFERVADGQA